MLHIVLIARSFNTLPVTVRLMEERKDIYL